MTPHSDITHITVVQGEARPLVDAAEEPQVMTFPHLVVRELIAFLALSIFLVTLSLVWDAPLEELANPSVAPNPAKAPWYFLGLQELLHYYAPFISGVLLPGVVIGALAVIPYFDINLERKPLWDGTHTRLKLAGIWGSVVALTALFYFTAAHPVWPIIGPLWATAIPMSLPVFGRRSLPFWIFLWFLLCAIALTVIGVFFRGPGWEYTLPWRDGIYT